MHIVHLALGPDVITSCLLDWTDPPGYVEGSNREKRLESLWVSYRNWCETGGIGERAQRRLFTSNVLKPDSGTYCEISQKTLNATASRYMVFWLASLASQFAERSGSDVDMSLVFLFSFGPKKLPLSQSKFLISEVFMFEPATVFFVCFSNGSPIPKDICEFMFPIKNETLYIYIYDIISVGRWIENL